MNWFAKGAALVLLGALVSCGGGDEQELRTDPPTVTLTVSAHVDVSPANELIQANVTGPNSYQSMLFLVPGLAKSLPGLEQGNYSITFDYTDQWDTLHGYWYGYVTTDTTVVCGMTNVVGPCQ
jgi:hypothetical protein